MTAFRLLVQHQHCYRANIENETSNATESEVHRRESARRDRLNILNLSRKFDIAARLGTIRR